MADVHILMTDFAVSGSTNFWYYTGAGAIGPGVGVYHNQIQDNLIVDLSDWTDIAGNERIRVRGYKYDNGYKLPYDDTFQLILPAGWSVVDVTDSYINNYGTYMHLYDENGTLVTNDFWVRADGAADLIVCFTRGAMVSGVNGADKKVEDLVIGDMVMTKSGTAKKVRWAGHSTLTPNTLEQFPNRRPIKFSAGALGGDHPEFTVSPQHKIYVEGSKISAAFGIDEALAPAKHLVNGTTIVRDDSCEPVDYFHIMFDQHEVMFVDGVWSESFYPGKYTMSSVSDAMKEEIVFLFPDLDTEDTSAAYGDLAFRTLKRREVVILNGHNSN